VKLIGPPILTSEIGLRPMVFPSVSSPLRRCSWAQLASEASFVRRRILIPVRELHADVVAVLIYLKP